MALVTALVSLVASVWRARGSRRFPLAVLVRDWLRANPRRGDLMIGVVAGFTSVLTVPLVGHVTGMLRIGSQGKVTFTWIGLAAASIALKGVLVFFEELVFRGSMCSELRRLVPPVLAAVVSAAIFTVAHAHRTPMGVAILLLDGIGFAAAFLVLGSLWLPIVWHLSKNVAVWLIYGTGTVALTSGPLGVEYLMPGRLVGSAAGPGIGDLVVALLVLGAVLGYLRLGTAPET